MAVAETTSFRSYDYLRKKKSNKVKFPKKQKIDKFTLEYSKNYETKFNNNLDKTQGYQDQLVAKNLRPYVSRKTGVQELKTQSYELGTVTIDVPYAEYQAYSKRIKKRVGKRGTQPFERMKSDKKGTILKQVAEYSRRLNG